MDPKEAISHLIRHHEVSLSKPGLADALSLAIDALALVDRLGVLEGIPEPVEFPDTPPGVKETAFGDVLLRKTRWRQAYPEITPWQYTTRILMSSNLKIKDGSEIIKLIRELLAAHDFLEKSRKH